MAHVSSTSFASSSFTARFLAVWAEFKEGRALAAKYRATVRELNELNDAELNDIGVSKSEISRIAHQSVYGN